MKKRVLKNLFTQCPTAEIMEVSKSDIPKRENQRGQKEDIYQYDLYISCGVQEGILRAAFFLARDLRLGGVKPIYQVFIDKEARKFVTWDAVHEKWSNSKLDRLSWPGCRYRSGVFMTAEDNDRMKEYLGVVCDKSEGILEFQRDVRSEELEKRHKKETDAWDAVMVQIPPCPEDWKNWVDKYGIPQNYLFYEYSRKKEQEGYCSWCEKMVPIEKPKHNRIGKCPNCGNEIQFKAIGKMARYFQTDKKTVHLIQPCKDGFVVRMFEARRWYRKKNYKVPEITCHEERRIIYNSNLEANRFYFGLYKNTAYRWIKGEPRLYGLFGYYYGRNDVGRIYPGTLSGLGNNELSRTGLGQMLLWKGEIDPEVYLDALKMRPYLEQLVKAELNDLAEDVFMNASNLEFLPGSDLAKRLGIDRMRMRRLKLMNGDHRLLDWLKYEKRKGTCFPDSLLQYFVQYKIEPAEIKFIEDRMSLARIRNYLKRQEEQTGRPPKELISTWYDYLFMAGRMNRDTTQELVYRPKDLIKSHDEALRVCRNGRMMKRAAELLKAYPDIEKIYQSIKHKYEYADKKYQIVVPEKVEDILKEGYALGHCLDRSNIYFDRIQRKESFIVFLRRAKQPNQPYYTLEIEPDGTARQKRTVGDKQNADFDEAKGFIMKWQRAIQRKLSQEDRLLAEESAKLRVEEFKQLRENGTKIWHGHLAGKLLADVLEADLMEAALCAASDSTEAKTEGGQKLLLAA